MVRMVLDWQLPAANEFVDFLNQRRAWHEWSGSRDSPRSIQNPGYFMRWDKRAGISDVAQVMKLPPLYAWEI